MRLYIIHVDSSVNAPSAVTIFMTREVMRQVVYNTVANVHIIFTADYICQVYHQTML